MKTFTDLEFKKHSGYPTFDTQAEMAFDNDYGVSVITGKGAYGSGSTPYELAVLYKGSICYSTPITDDVIGHLNEDGVTNIMKQVQELPMD